MGFFSWKTQDTRKSICNKYQGSKPTFTVYMTDNQGNRWREDNYDGIVDLAIKFGSIDENPNDKLFNKVCENYWLFMANVICGMEQSK